MRRTSRMACRRLVESLAAVLIGVPCSEADVPPFDCSVEIGFANTIRRQGGVFPVTVTLVNRGPAARGTIEVVLPGLAGHHQVTDRTAFAVPAATSMTVRAPVRLEPDRTIAVRLKLDDDRAMISRMLHPTRSREPLVLCVDTPTRTAGGQPSPSYRFVETVHDAVPADPIALEDVHAVIVSGSAFESMATAQITALAHWATTGGTVIFHDPLTTPAFAQKWRQLLGERAINVYDHGVRSFGAGVLGSTGAEPTDDLGIWERDEVLRLFPEQQDCKYGGGLFVRLQPTWDSYGVQGVFWIVAIVAAYMCAIGPLDQWAVHRLHKPSLTWLMFPTVVGVFSSIAYAYTGLVNLTAMRMTQVSVVDAAADGAVARGRATVWLYSAKQATYDLFPGHSNVLLSAREGPLGEDEVTGVEVVNGAVSHLSARMPIFSEREFDALWYMPWTPAITRRTEHNEVVFTLPPAINVTDAFLATEDGLAPLSRRGLDWVVGRREPWPAVVPKLVSAVRAAHHGACRAFYRHDTHRRMPSEQVLRDYLLLVSFPWHPDSRFATGSVANATVTHTLNVRDARELALDIRPHLRRGDTLLLFHRLPGRQQPLSVRRYWPITASIALTRVQLPHPTARGTR